MPSMRCSTVRTYSKGRSAMSYHEKVPRMPKRITYKKAGVNIDEASRAVNKERAAVEVHDGEPPPPKKSEEPKDKPAKSATPKSATPKNATQGDRK